MAGRWRHAGYGGRMRIGIAGPARPNLAPVLGAAAVLLAGVGLADRGTPSRAVVWGGLAFACYACCLLLLVTARDRIGAALAAWRLGPWMLAWYALAFGLATVTWAQPQTGIAAEVDVTSVLRALWLLAVGMTVWAAGYLLGPGQPVRRAATTAVGALGRRFSGEVRSPLAPWILYAIGAAARVVSALTSHRLGYVGDVATSVTSASGYGQLLALLGFCAPLAVAAAALQVFRERVPGAAVTLAVLLMAELGFSVASGVKQNFVVAFLAVAIPFGAARKRLPIAAIAASVLVFLLIVVPFSIAYRGLARGSSGTLSTSQAISAAPGVLAQTVTGGALVSALPTSLKYLMTRVRQIDSAAIIIQRTPGQIGYRSPLELIDAPLAGMVPRAVWPSKPILDTGYEFNQQYFGQPSTEYTSTAVTLVGDLYRHGGWIPVLVGMFLLGCGVRLLDLVFDVRSNPHAVLLVLLVFPDVILGEADWATMLAGIPGTICLWVLAVCLTFRARRPGPGQGSAVAARHAARPAQSRAPSPQS
jgi:hypothetical protein